MLLNTWIMQRNGTLLFHKCFNPLRVDNNLLAGFLSAMESFMTEITHEGLKTVILKDKKFTYALSNNLLFIVLTGELDNNIFIKDVIVKIQDQFQTKYQEDLTNFKYNTAIFNDFEQDLDLILKDRDLELSCTTCRKNISDQFLTKSLGATLIYFCCLSCQKEFNYKKNITPALRSELEGVLLVCKQCHVVQNIPIHCEKPMHVEVINGQTVFVCWMGQRCNLQMLPKHCNEVMQLEYLEQKTLKSWRRLLALV